jgi:DNA repair protein RadC
MSVAELEFNGFSNSEAIRINAALELGKRSVMADKTDMPSITSPEDCVGLLMPLLRYETHEKFVVIILNAKNKVLGIRQISEGSLSSAVVHPREVFQKAIMNHAAAIICAHNHPSGDPTPSKEDKDLTSTLAATGKILGIPVLDHVVVGDGLYYSFKEHSNL